jgi:hypothetical protein
MAMAFGIYNCEYYPTQFTIPRPKKSNAYIETYESVGHFSWGFLWPGKIIEVDWDKMPSEQFDSLDTIWQNDEEIVWDPDIPGLSQTYNVQILDFDGDFFESTGIDPEIWRQNCKMTLLIMSAIGES